MVISAREWLRQNEYSDIAALIDQVMAEFEASGSKERRNWWAILAGGRNGKPRVINGHEFPVLRVAQVRQDKPVTPNAIARNAHEMPPDVVSTPRWPARRLPAKAKGSTRKITRKPAHARAS